MGRDIRNIAKVAFATVGSRVLGLIRDSFTMAYMSIGAVSAAYTFAFTLPNLFRRLLGEGALTSAMIPIFTQTLKQDGEQTAFSFLNKVFTRGAILMLGISLLGMLIAFVASMFLEGEQQRFVLSANFSIVLMPYLTLICLAAVFTAALNVLGSFGVPSITPAIHNATIIGGLFFGVFFFGANDTVAIAYCMCVAWLVGGAFQLGLPAYWLYRQGWRYSFDLRPSKTLSELYALFVPALLGAAVYQLNVFVSKILALFIDNSALPSLYLSSRIIEFPLGVFTLAIATVYFPKLAKMATSNSNADFLREYANGFIMTMCIAIPATFGIIATAPDIISLLFQWGLFNSADSDICVPVLIASSCGLPFFALSTFATRGFHSHKDTRTPVRISYWSFGANIILSIALMKSFGAVGLALANVLATMLFAVMLELRISKIRGRLNEWGEVVKIVVSGVLMAVIVWALRMWLADFIEGKTLSIVVCTGLIPAGVLIYIILLKVLKFRRLDNLKKMILRK